MRRIEKIAMKMVRERVGMAEDDREDFGAAVELMKTRLEDFGEEIGESDFSRIGEMEKQMKWVKREALNLEDEVVRRELDNGMMEVSKFLNDVENARRRWEDIEIGHKDMCRHMGHRAQGLAKLFERIEVVG